MTIADAAARTGIPRTAARRYLLSLCHYGYADHDGKHYWLTPRVLRLGQGYLEAARLPRLVRPFIQQLSTATGETVNVSVLDGFEVVYVARSNSPRLVSIGFHPGARAPAHVVSPGTVLLAALKDAALARWIERHDFAAFNPNTVTDRAAFLAQVQRAKAQGHWVADGQLDTGLTGIAVPLKDRRGRSAAAIGMTVQRVQWDPARIVSQLLPALQGTAQSLRAVL
jgi:IclR family pca regulon transcriptional regulator